MSNFAGVTRPVAITPTASTRDLYLLGPTGTGKTNLIKNLVSDDLRAAQRSVEDERLLARIREVHEANYCAYGYRRTWKALLRAGEMTGRGRVQRLMAQAHIQGAKRRGKPWRTTTPDPDARRRPDLVERDFTARRPEMPMTTSSPRASSTASRPS